MDLNESNILQIVDNTLIIDCVEITLTKNQIDNPQVYSGSGSLYKKDDGYFYLKLYHIYRESPLTQFSTFGKPSPGKLIQKDNYFCMKATDIKGNEWSSERIIVPLNLSFPSVGQVVETKLHDIKKVKPRSDSSNKKLRSITTLVKGSYDIPLNEVETRSDGSSSLSKCVIDIHGVELSIIKRDSYMLIDLIDSSNNIDEKYQIKLIESLNIYFGKISRQLFVSYSDEKIITFTLTSSPSEFLNDRISPPTKYKLGSEAIIEFKEFLEKYLDSFNAKHKILYGHWYKINRSWQAGIEHSALSITTSIEGIAKEYLTNYGAQKQEIIEAANETLPLISKLEIDQKIKERLIANLKQVENPNIRRSLTEFADQHHLSKALVQRWNSLRNKAAHADNLESDQLQKYIDDVFICLTLFYLLLLYAIGYQGSYMDRMLPKWPDAEIDFSK